MIWIHVYLAKLEKILKNQTEKDADEIEHDMSNAHFELVLRKKILAFSQVKKQLQVFFARNQTYFSHYIEYLRQ